MKARAIRSVLIGFLGVALALASGSASAIAFRITDLGTLSGGQDTDGTDLNASGQATGFSRAGAAFLPHAFLWDGTTLQDLGTLGGDFSAGNAINDSGLVTGVATTEPAEPRSGHAFLWDGTTMQDLGTRGRFSVGADVNSLGQVTGRAGFTTPNAFLWDGTTLHDLGTLGGDTSQGVAINDAGHVTGSSTTADGEEHAFLWDGSTMLDLGTLQGRNSRGLAINDSGQVTGFSDTTDMPFAAPHAFLWDGTTMVDLGTLGGTSSAGIAINAPGQVTGNSSTEGDAGSHAFLWDSTMMVDLGTLGGTFSAAAAINDSGQVTGISTDSDGSFRAFFWDGTTMHDVNDLIALADPLRRFVLLEAGVDINNRGQILVNGFDSRIFGRRSFILTPTFGTVPEPGTLALLGLGLLGLRVVRAREAGRGFDEHTRNSFHVDRFPGRGACARLGVCLGDQLSAD